MRKISLPRATITASSDASAWLDAASLLATPQPAAARVAKLKIANRYFNFSLIMVSIF
jgi:hypothetical protein